MDVWVGRTKKLEKDLPSKAIGGTGGSKRGKLQIEVKVLMIEDEQNLQKTL